MAKYLIKRRFHFHVETHVMCPWSLTYLILFNCFFKPIRISWSNFYQLHLLMLTHRTHDIMIFRGMNGKLASENSFWKWISRRRRKWWNDCSKLSLSRLKKCKIKECKWVAKTFMKCGIKECESTNCFRKCGTTDCDPSISREMRKQNLRGFI